MTAAVWCKSGRVPVLEGTYQLRDGTLIAVRQSRSGRFYASVSGRFAPGLVWRLRSELDAGTAVALGAEAGTHA